MAIPPGKTISHYRILVKLRRWHGLVYEAEDRKLGRHVALEFLPEELAPIRRHWRDSSAKHAPLPP